MTNTPGSASPGSPDSTGPDNGDSPDPTAEAATADAEPADAGPADAAPAEPVLAEPAADAAPAADAPEATGGPSEPPRHGAWSPQQPPPGEWRTPSARDTAAPTPVQPAPQQATPTHPAGGWGQQWAHPAPPPPPQEGGPRWGPAAGQHGGGWQPGFVYAPSPQAPKPGVVPLRPLDAGEIMTGAFTTLRLHWRAALLLVVGVALLTETINALVSGFLIDDTRLNDLDHDPHPSGSDILHAFSGMAAGSALVILTTMVGLILASGLLTIVMSRAVLGRPTGLRSVWRDIRPRFPHLLGLAFLLPLALVTTLAVLALPGVLIAVAGAESGGVALALLGVIGGMILCIWQWNLWSLTAPALLLEKQGIKAAVKRSVKLVSGSWWRVFGVQLLVSLVTGIASFVLQLPFTAIAAAAGGGVSSFFSADSDLSATSLAISALGGFVSATLTLPVSAGAVSLLYVDQRIRREALDVELARAANVSGYEPSRTTAPAGAHR